MIGRESGFVSLDRVSILVSTISTLQFFASQSPAEFSTSCVGRTAAKRLARFVLSCSVARANMFRISVIDGPQERRVMVEGNLMDPWVAELRRTWAEAGNSL